MRIQKTLIFLACLAMLTSVAWGLSSQTGKMQSSNQAQILDTRTYLDINSLLCFVYNDGNYAYDNANILGKTDGLYFPRGTKKTVIYAAGIWVGAVVNDTVRTVVAEYGSEFVPGPIVNGTFVPDNAGFRVYKIDRASNAENSADYAEWPADEGAPVDSEGNPALIGDQMCWAVYNDADASSHNIDAGSSTIPLGMEIQQTTFAYGRTGSLGQVIFVKYLIINKGEHTLEDTYISLWADPDLGGASDDLVGCDTVLSMGFCYNDAGVDNTYGTAPPAVGFDFFQGPLVEGEAGDSGKFMGQWYHGKKNLPMSSFNKYTNGTDPHSATETYNYMQGLKISGEPLYDSTVNPPVITTYMHAGDPVSNTGWNDQNGDDRRFMMTTGPFTMMPGDTQEVVSAIVVGQGSNRLSSITEMKTVDAQAQIVFDLNFDIPAPPPNPIVWARAYDGAIDLTWTPADTAKNWPEEHYQDYIEKLGEFYVFEGYNIYQGLSPQGPWTKVATYDYAADESYHFFGELAGDYYITCEGEDEEMVCDSVERPWDFQLLYMDAVNTAKGGIETTIAQSGSESGLINHLYIDRSYLDGGPIINNRPYYFAITPYSVNIQNVGAMDSVYSGNTYLGFKAASLENVIIPNTVVPLSSTATLIDTATHTGPSQGMVVIDYLDYVGETADDYEVSFNEDGTWNLSREGIEVLTDQENQSGDYNYSLVDGLMVRVMGPVGGIAPSANSASGGIVEIQNASGPVSPPDNVFWSLNSTRDYYVGSNQDGSGDAARAAFNRFGYIGWESWEFRFTEEGSDVYNYITGDKMTRAPFEVWHFSENETEPDKRVQFEIYDLDASGTWSWGDLTYVTAVEYTEPLPDVNPAVWTDDYILHRVKFIQYGTLDAPATGTIVRFNSTVPNGTGDTYTFTSKPVGVGDGTVIAKNLDDVLVIPNPYYNYSVLERDQFDRQIKFVNLPPARCTIKIFNIAGDLVREMVKDNLADAELVWDVKTNQGLFVASGIYVYYIEADGIGNTFGKMIVFTEVEQLNTY